MIKTDKLRTGRQLTGFTEYKNGKLRSKIHWEVSLQKGT